jgi:hypothetical protein
VRHGARQRCGSTRVHAVPIWVALCSLGCLADPPTFAPRGQIPPFIIAAQVDPPLALIYDGPASFGVTVPFRSEDVNVDLKAALYLDLVPGAIGPTIGTVLGVRDVPAGNFEELRSVSMNVRVLDLGCHSLTLIMTYEDNVDELRNDLPRDDNRAARIIWWLNIGDEDGETTMSECPAANPVDAVPSGG